MNAVGSLLFLAFVPLWHQAVCQNSQEFTLFSDNTVPTNPKGTITSAEGGSVKICLNPSQVPNEPSEVRVRTKDGTAKAPGDYTKLDRTLTFTKDESQCVWFYPNLDVEDEDDETFTFEAQGGSGDYDDITVEVTVTITDQAISEPSFSFEHDNYPAVESSGEVTVCVAYYGTQPLASSATVQLSTVDGSLNQGESPASEGTDYVSESDDLTFSAGTVSGTSKCITIKLVMDNITETDESLQLSLQPRSTSGVTVGPYTSATVRITETETVVADEASTGGTGGARGGVSPAHSPLSVLTLLALGFLTFTVLNRQ